MIKAHVFSATNPTAWPRKLKIAPRTLSTIAGNASTPFPTSLLRASASLFNHFFKVPSSFGVDAESPPPAKTLVIVSTIVVMGI